MTAASFLAAALAAWAGDFDVRGTTAAMLGEPLALEVTVNLPPTISVEPDAAASSTDTYAVLGAAPSGVPRRWRFDVLPLAVGKLPVVLAFTLSDGSQTRRAASPPFSLQVAEPPGLGTEPQLYDIKEPLAARAALWPWIAALLAAFALWWLWRHRRRKADPSPQAAPPDPRTPQEAALADLDALEASGLWEDRRAREFYVALTDILRRYLERRFSIPAWILTTAEIIRQMRRADIDRRLTGAAQTLLERSDLVKFARWAPGIKAGPEDLAEARAFVRETAPRDLAAAAK